MNQPYTFSPKIENAAKEALSLCQNAFEEADRAADFNQQKVHRAFADCRVSESHFAGSTGYGYGDPGREVLDRVFAQITGSESALARHNFVSGTHAISTALFGVLRPGDTLLAVTGKPYDTLEEVIGLKGQGNGSLSDFGVHYSQIELLPDGSPDLAAIRANAPGKKAVYIQRSRGYSLRDSMDVETIGKIVRLVKGASPGTLVIVDNCYGEFVEETEPTDAGADLIVGSLIKNPGGGIAKTGGYIAGNAKAVELCSYRLTSPGMGGEVGCTLGETRNMLMGLYLAPTVTASAVKTAIFAAALFELLGYEVFPRYDAKRTDIIQAVKLGSRSKLTAFCRGIQKGAPVDSFVIPEAWDMPGYGDKVIMAAGAFTMGASIELSADAPMREPYAVWLQGGLTFPSGKLGVMLAAQNLIEN